LVAGLVEALGAVFATFADYMGADVQGTVQQKRYRYTGKERDDSSGLCYYGARYLAPWLARWISPS
jgi:RHS repeat-associated protein